VSSMDTGETVKQLHKVLAELEGLAKAAAEATGEGGSDLIGRLKGTLSSARERIKEAEQKLEHNAAHGAKAADQYVHDHTWMSIGIAAAVAFLLGAMTSRRD
jgi:ElaB/YqjD/DUF883 family membrane-anchored ribosome-binding protein